MLIVMDRDASQPQVDRVVEVIEARGWKANIIPGGTRVSIGITHNPSAMEPHVFLMMDGVAEAIPVSKPYKLVSREVKRDDTVVKVDSDCAIGGENFTVIAGPCAVEGEESLLSVAREVKKAGATFLRGGAYKPRTSPYSFQGMRKQGLEILKKAREETGLRIITEVKDVQTLDLVAEYADVLQVGARNMQNFTLLEAVGKVDKPVLLKRGMSSTINELLMAAEYIVSNGNYRIIYCERGIRTFETITRNTLDLGAVTVLKKLSHLPVIVDPSHGLGLWYGVPPLCRAALAVGADGIMVEVHNNPLEALSDGAQSITPQRFASMMEQMRKMAPLLDKKI